MIRTLDAAIGTPTEAGSGTSQKARLGLSGIEIIVFAIVLGRVAWMCL